jgi:transketolase
MHRFGGSAPAQEVFEKMGITATHVVNEAKRVLGKV